MPYRAQLSGPFGGGSLGAQPHVIDIAGALDAATHGATTLIQNAYARKVKDRELVMEQQRMDREQTQHQEQIALEREKLAATKLSNGIVPAGTSATTTAQPDVNTTAPIVQAMQQPDQSGGLNPPVPQTGLFAPQSLPSIPKLNVVDTPEGYDPNADPRLGRGLAMIGARSEGALTLEDHRAINRSQLRDQINAGRLEQIAEQARARAEQSAAHDARVGARAGVARPMTANGQAAYVKTLADGLVGASEGDFAAAKDYLDNDPVGQQYAKNGLSVMDLHAAAGRYHSKVATQDFNANTGFQRSNFVGPAAAGARVKETRKVSAAPVIGAAPAPPPTAAAPVATAPPAHAVDPASVTDNEAAAAYTAGMRSDAEITNWVAQHRKQ